MAFRGQYENLKIEFPEDLTEELVFNIKKDLVKLELKEILSFY